MDGFSLVEADALTFDAASAFPGEPFKVVANIPYHITSPLLHGFLEGERPPELVVLLVQAEVAERIAAPPGQMSYLSVFAQNVAEVEIVTRVSGRRLRAGAQRRLGGAAPAPPRARRWCLPVAAARAVLPAGAGRLPAAAQAAAQRARRESWARTARCWPRRLRPAGSSRSSGRRPSRVEQWACLLAELGPVLEDAA